MNSVRKPSRQRSSTLCGLLAFSAFLLIPAAATAGPLPPQTKFRLTVVQWKPDSGEYAKWNAISGDYVISADGAVSLPLIGSIATAGLDDAALAKKIQTQLKEKVGLIAQPDASIEILEYPPIYIIGSVATPGAYPFQPGISVLQALAIGGGLYRANAEKGAEDQVSLLGDLKNARDDILRMLGRLARLQAERLGAKEITFPAELTGSSEETLKNEIVAQEKLIFAARANALERQLSALSELKSLFSAEIDTLDQKTASLDTGLKSLQKELSNVESLVKRGIVPSTRQSELERGVSAVQADRLDLVMSEMRARQNISQATRDGLNLHDQRETEVASELQTAEADLERLRTRREVLERLLSVASINEEALREDAAGPETLYSIVRRTADGYAETQATESTALLPGDVVKVAVRRPSGSKGASGASLAERSEPGKAADGPI